MGEAMVGADSVMERRTEMMRALAGENFELLTMLELRETGGAPQHMTGGAPQHMTGGAPQHMIGGAPQQIAQEGHASAMRGAPMSQNTESTDQQEAPEQPAPFQAWGEAPTESEGPYTGHMMP